MASAAVEDVGACTSDKDIVPALSDQSIIATEAADHVASGRADKQISPACRPWSNRRSFPAQSCSLHQGSGPGQDCLRNLHRPDSTAWVPTARLTAARGDRERN